MDDFDILPGNDPNHGFTGVNLVAHLIGDAPEVKRPALDGDVGGGFRDHLADDHMGVRFGITFPAAQPDVLVFQVFFHRFPFGFGIGPAALRNGLRPGLLHFLFQYGFLDQFDHVVRERHVVEFFRRVAPGGEAPVEVGEEGLPGFRLQVVAEEAVGHAHDRPGFFAGLIGQVQTQALGVGPVGVGGAGAEARGIGLDEFTGLIFEQDRGHFGFIRVGVFGITDRAADLGDIVADAGVLLAADADRPLHRAAAADLIAPFRRNLRQVVGEDEAGAAGVGAAHHRDLERGQLQLGVQRLNFGRIPAGDSAEIDGAEGRAVKFHGVGGDSGQVHDHDYAAGQHRELLKSGLLLLFQGKRIVGPGEVDGAGLDLIDAGAGADALIVDADAGCGLTVAEGPVLVDRSGKTGAGAIDHGLGGSQCGDGRNRGGQQGLFQHGDTPFLEF
ncbi:hypothetical protein SDC9_99765 [bioreactor metagenome]|uniref:NAD-specific glutamate dehydrogenase n=1 Tax=bioreactor metagenome TaxID=1076179 RepID=A0A645AL19_9ZZZZ